MANVIEVEAGGKIFEFPADTPRDVMSRALRQHFGFQEPQRTITPATLPSDFQIPVETPPSVAPPIPEPQAETPVQPLAGTMAGFESAFPAPEEPVAAPAPVAPTEPAPYASRAEALDDAVNMLEEGADQAQVFAGFGRLGITPQEITQHGQARGSAFFQQERVEPGTVLPTEPSGRMQAFEPGMVQQIADDFKRAKTSLSDQMTNFLLQTGGISPVDAAQLIRRNARQRSAAAPNETIQRGMEAIGGAETFGDAAKAMLDNPRATWAMLVDSILTSAPGLAATLVVAPAGIPARAAAAFLTSGGMEYASVMTDVLQDKKVDLTDAEQVAKALQNPEILAEMKEKGAKRGLIIGGFDAISMGLAGRFVGPANELISAGKLTGSAAKKATVAAWSKELALQMAGGAGGEFAAQQATGENQPAAVILEALGEAVLAPAEVRAALSEAQTREAAARPEAQIARAIQEGVDASSFVPGSSEQIAIERLTGPQSLASQARAEAAVQAIRREPELPAAPVAPAAPEPSIITEPTVEGRPEPTITTEPPVIGREEPLLPGEAPAPARVVPLSIGLPDVEEENLRAIKTEEDQAVASGETPVVTVAPPSEIVEEPTEPTEPVPSTVSTTVSEGIPVVYPLVSALKLSDDVPQFKEDADQKGVVNKLTGKFDWRDFGAIQVWQRLNGDLEVISGRHRLDLAQRSGIERVPAQIYREADGFTAQDAAILDAELNIRDEKGTVKDYVQYFQGSGINQEEAQSRGLLDNVKGQRAFNIANFGSPELIASHGARQLSDEAASQIALAAPKDSRLQAVGLKVRQDGKSDEAAVNAVRAVKAIAREQNTTTDMFGFDDSLIKEAVEMAKIAERKQKELANRIAVLSKVSKNPKIAEQEGIDIKDPKAVASRIQELKDLRAAWNNWETNPDLINEIRQERGAFELTAETEEQRAAREAEEEATRRAEAEAAAETERKAKADRERGEFVLTGSDRPADELEARGQEALFGAEPSVTPEVATGTVIESKTLPDNIEVRVFKTSDGYGVGSYDLDSGNVIDQSVVRYTGDDALSRATQQANEREQKARAPLQDKFDTPDEEADQIANLSVREKLKKIAQNLKISVFETSDQWSSKLEGYVNIPPEDKVVESALSPEHVFAHELGHAILQKRGMSFNRMTKAQVERWIPGFSKLVPISKQFRPAIHGSSNPATKRHAKKNDEIIADALGSFLINQSSREDISPLIDGLKLSDFDLGLKKFDREKHMQKMLDAIQKGQTTTKGDDPTLANISNIPKNQRGAVLGARSREETIRTYQGLKTKIGALIRKLIKAEGEKRVEQVLDIQDKLKVLDEYAKELKFEIDASKPPRRTPEDFLARVTKAYADGDISTEVFEAARAIYDKYPQLLNGLKLGIRKAPESGIIGDFVGFARLIRLYKETEGVLSSDTIRHEIAHSMEQMMDADQRAAVIDEYTKQLKRAIEQNKDNPEAQKYFDAVLKFLANPSQEAQKDAVRAMPSYDYYQYLNPSEYWAVNAEPMMRANLGGAWNRFKLNMRRLFEGLKSVFGFNNRYQSHKVLRDLLQAKAERMSRDMLLDYINNSSSAIDISNINQNQDRRQEVNDLLDQYNRPVVLGRGTKDAERTLLPTATRLKDIYKRASDADGRAADSLTGLLHRGLAFARNKVFFSGAGLEEADARRYGRQLVTANDQATATLALDNMLHGGGIAVEFLTRGGIEYNPETKRIQAVQADGNMMDVYRLEKALVDELGDKAAKGLINGYFEAKRSQSIKDEMASLTEDLEEKSQEYEDEYNNLQSMLQNPQSSQAQIAAQTKTVDRLKKESQELKQQLDDITQINEDKVLMDDDEIAAFIDQENNFPQLREMMDSWTAQNHRLLGLMRQVRLISEKRYDRLIGIKDYVPWQRVQDDDGDVHGPAPSRSITRIPKEPKFRKGKAEAPIEYVIDNMTDNLLRLTMNSLRQYAAGRVVSEYATRNEKGQVKTFPKEDRDRGRFAYISDGRRVVVEIKDPLIAESVYGSDSVDLRMNEALAAATNFVRRAITIDPFFQMAQVIKDAPTAAIVTGVRNPAALMGQVMTSFAGVISNTDPVADILRANGIGGFQSIARTPEKRLKQKVGLETRSIPQATLALLDHIGDASDFAARMAAYKRTMAETGDQALALYRAANVINFNRMGSSRIIRQFIRYVNFANAYFQSVDTLVTALSGRGMRGQDTKKAMTQVALTMSYLAGATLLYSFLIGDDEEYQKLDDATKVRNFYIPKKITKELGMENGILIPMNTTASFMFKALPELTYQNYVSQATQSPMDAARYRKAVAEAAADALLGPEPVPSAIRPIVEIAMNRSFFTEKSLTPRGMETLEKSRQFTDQTSELAKQLGQFGGLSPIEWDHLIRGTTGTAGMLVQYGSNMIGEALNVRPESTTKQLPMVGRFVAPEFGRGREALFYDLHERVRKATSTLKDLEATGELDKAEKFAEENEELLSLSRWSNKTEAKLKKLNAEIRLLSRGKEEGTAAERRRDIRELQRAKEEELEGIEFLRKVDAGL